MPPSFFTDIRRQAYSPSGRYTLTCVYMLFLMWIFSLSLSNWNHSMYHTPNKFLLSEANFCAITGMALEKNTKVSARKHHTTEKICFHNNR